MDIKYDFTDSVLWDNCSEESKKFLTVPNIFGHTLLKYSENIDFSNISNFIETGTSAADTSVFFSHMCEFVYTVEKHPDLHHPNLPKSLRQYYEDYSEKYKNINFMFGDSTSFLKEIFNKYPDERFFILLDAHDHTDCPLLEEVTIILEYSNVKNHIIMIDDCSFLDTLHYPSRKELYSQIKKINPEYNIINTKIGNDIHLVY